jgi:POT family proton-dependent oligopeptide transporter
MWAVANGAFTLPGDISLALALMILVMVVVIVWFMWYVLSQCTQVQRHQMISLMVLIFMCLVFFTMYEQTYGSWVTFTDRLLTKDIVPSMVIREGTPLPWSIISLLLAPASFVIAATMSDRNPDSKAPKLFFALSFAVMLVFLVRDSVVLPQTGGSLTYLGAIFLVLLAPLFSALWGWLDRFRRRSFEAGEERRGPDVRRTVLHPARARRAAGRCERRRSQRVVAGARLLRARGRRDVPVAGRAVRGDAAVDAAGDEPDDGHLVPRHRLLGNAGGAPGQARRDRDIEGRHWSRTPPNGPRRAKYEHLFWLMMWIGSASPPPSPRRRRCCSAMHGVK